MLSNFRVYRLARLLYRECEGLRVPAHLRSQLSRASSSIPLNIAEGLGRRTHADQRNFFTIAYGSTKEVQAILDLVGESPQAAELADHVAACLYKLTRRAKA
jgi:four helix bundle protein